MASIISLLNSSKASNPNSMPCRILFFIKNGTVKQMEDLSNLFFMTSVFPSVLKTAEVLPVLKKDSKLNYSNYRPISLLTNIEKIYEKLSINDCTLFSIRMILSITYSLASDTNISNLMP